MKLQRTGSRKGFSLVELLAVVLVLAVLAAVAIPLYTSQRQSSAARACKANLAAIASSLAGYALRNNAYPTTVQTLSVLVGSAEGLTEVPKCPLGTVYTYTSAAGIATVACAAASVTAHTAVLTGSVAADWTKTLAAPAVDSLP